MSNSLLFSQSPGLFSIGEERQQVTGNRQQGIGSENRFLALF